MEHLPLKLIFLWFVFWIVRRFLDFFFLDLLIKLNLLKKIMKFLSSIWILSKRFFHFLQFWRGNSIWDNEAKAVSNCIMALKGLTQLNLNLWYAILPLSAILKEQQHWGKWRESCIRWHYGFKGSHSDQSKFNVSYSSSFCNFEGATALGIMERKLYPTALWLWKVSPSSN